MTDLKAIPSRHSKKRRRRKLFIILGLILVLVIALFLICGKKGASMESVTTSKVEKGDIVSRVNATGRVKPKAEVNIQAEIYEIIIDIPVDEGDTVKQGDLLVKLKQTAYQFEVDKALAELKTAEASYNQAVSSKEYWEFKYNQAKELFDKKLGSEEDYISIRDQYNSATAGLETARQAVRMAKIALDEARDYYEKTEIVSPIDGVVTDLNYEVGERTMIASPNVAGAIIMTVADLSVLEVEVRVDETDIRDLKIGQESEIAVDAFSDTVFAGVVTSVGASAQVSGSSYSEEVTDFLVKVQFLEKYDLIKPNLTAEVDIITGQAENILKLPIQAIVALDILPGHENDTLNSPEGEGVRSRLYEGVYVYMEGAARFHPVVLGIQDQSNIEIKSGLDEGQEIITGPYRALRNIKDGDMVIKNKEYKK